MLLRLAWALSLLLLLCLCALLGQTDAVAVPASSSLDSFELPTNVKRAIESNPSLHRRLTMGCWVDENGHPPPDDDVKNKTNAALVGQSKSSNSSSSSSSSSDSSAPPQSLESLASSRSLSPAEAQGIINTTLVGAPDALDLPHDDPNYIPPLCSSHLHVCYFVASGVWRDSGSLPIQTFVRSDNSTVLVYPIGKPCVHFTGAKGSGLIYAAHGCILMCGEQRIGMDSVMSTQHAEGVEGDPQIYCAVDRIKWDQVWVYNT